MSFYLSGKENLQDQIGLPEVYVSRLILHPPIEEVEDPCSSLEIEFSLVIVALFESSSTALLQLLPRHFILLSPV